MSNITINWSRDLKNPLKPGTYYIDRIGEITVNQQEIDAATREEAPDVEISEVTSQGDNIRKFILGPFIPKQKKDAVWDFIKNNS